MFSVLQVKMNDLYDTKNEPTIYKNEHVSIYYMNLIQDISIEIRVECIVMTYVYIYLFILNKMKRRKQ